MMDTIDVTKLSKKVQAHIRVLERTVEGLEEELRAYQGDADSPISQRELVGFGRRSLTSRPVQFRLGAGAEVEVQLDHDMLDVSGIGSGALVIKPMAANRFHPSVSPFK